MDIYVGSGIAKLGDSYVDTLSIIFIAVGLLGATLATLAFVLGRKVKNGYRNSVVGLSIFTIFLFVGTLVLGIISALLLWENDAARIGIYALAFGDGLASLFGKLFGKRRIPFTSGKTYIGSITCFVAVFISSFCVCKNLLYSLLIAFVAMVLEMLPLKDFDNVLLPVCIGALAQFLIP